MLTQMCLHFVLCQEFSHIYNGHVDYLNQSEGVHLITELHDEEFVAVAGLDRENIEFDADMKAVYEVMIQFLLPIISEEGNRWQLRELYPTGTVAENIILVVAPIVICSYIFSNNEKKDYRDFEPSVHPHALFRAMSNLSQIDHVLSSKIHSPPDAFQHITLAAAKTSVQAFCAAFGLENREEDAFDAELDAAYRARLKIWTSEWERLHPILDQMKRGGRLAPAVPAAHPGEA